MRKVNIFLILGSILFLTSCAARVNSTIHRMYLPLDSTEEVVVFGLNEEVPSSAERLGTVRISDSGLTIRCSFEIVLEKAKTEARRVGGNALRITEHRVPDFWSTCHRITTEIFRIEDIENYMAIAQTDRTDYVLAYEIINDFPRFRFAVDGGWQRRTARLSPDLEAGMREHYRRMLSGFHGSIRGAYFFDRHQGVELMFSRQMFGNSPDGIFTFDDGNHFISGSLNNKMTISYIGANYVVRLFDSRGRNSWLFSIGAGYVGYNNRFIFNDAERVRTTAGALGSYASIAYDIKLSENFGMFFQVSTISGSFRHFDLTIDGVTTRERLPERTSEGLGTIKFSVGLRF